MVCLYFFEDNILFLRTLQYLGGYNRRFYYNNILRVRNLNIRNRLNTLLILSSSVLHCNSDLDIGLYTFSSLLLAYLLSTGFEFRLLRGRLWDWLLKKYLEENFDSCIYKLLNIIDVRSIRSLRLNIRFVKRSI